MMKKLQCLLVFAFLLVGSSTVLAQTLVRASLDGGQEEPKIISAATADATYYVYSNRIEFVIRLRQFGTDVTMMHVHFAPEGLSGPIVLNLYDRAVHGPIADTETIEGGVFFGVATALDTRGRINDSTMVRGIRNFDDVRAALMNPAGPTYTNIHTMSVGGGEIRGQNRPVVEEIR